MKINGQKIEDPASRTSIEMCGEIIKRMKTLIIIGMSMMVVVVFFLAAYHDNIQISESSICKQRVLTLSSPIKVKRADGEIIDTHLSEFADYAIEQYWQNIMIEEESRQ